MSTASPELLGPINFNLHILIGVFLQDTKINLTSPAETKQKSCRNIYIYIRCDRYSIIGRVPLKDLTGKPSMAITQAIKPCRSAPRNLESVICNLEKH